MPGPAGAAGGRNRAAWAGRQLALPLGAGRGRSGSPCCTSGARGQALSRERISEVGRPVPSFQAPHRLAPGRGVLWGGWEEPSLGPPLLRRRGWDQGEVSPSGASLFSGTGFCGSGAGEGGGQTFDPVPCRVKRQSCRQARPGQARPCECYRAGGCGSTPQGGAESVSREPGEGRDARRNGVHGPQPFPRFPFRGLFLFKSLTCASGGQKSTKILPLARGSSECVSAEGSR